MLCFNSYYLFDLTEDQPRNSRSYKTFLMDLYSHGDFEQIQLFCPTDNLGQLWQYA